VFWIAFILQERRTREPLINLSLFSNRAYSLQNVSILLIQMAMAGVMVVMPFYLELVRHIMADNAGTVLLALPVGMILTAPIAGKMSDVIGTKKPIITGFADQCVALYLPLHDISGNEYRGHRDDLSLLTRCGNGIAYSPLNSAVMGEAPAKDRGSTSGLMRVMTNLGSTLGVSVVMLVLPLLPAEDRRGRRRTGSPHQHWQAHSIPCLLLLHALEVLGTPADAGVQRRNPPVK